MPSPDSASKARRQGANTVENRYGFVVPLTKLDFNASPATPSSTKQHLIQDTLKTVLVKMKLCTSPINKRSGLLLEDGKTARKKKVITEKEAEDRSPAFKFVPTVVPLPFCYGHSMFYQFFRKICKDQGDSIVLAGSSALERRMMDHHGSSAFQPNDVDFFTSAHLKQGEVFERVKEFNKIQSEYTLDVVQIKLPHTYPQYHNNGIHSIYNFRLSQNLGVNWCTPLVLPGPQLICMKTSRYGGRDFNRFVDKVLDSFDISVCKCAILDPLAMESVYTLADGDIKKR